MKSELLRAHQQATTSADGDVPKVNLALQGGGSHGAFTWGVLDRLLEEVEAGRLRIDGVTGTSAGAMNAAVLVYGLETEGAAGARSMLDKFWRGVSDRNLLTPLHDLHTTLTGNRNIGQSPAVQWLQMWQDVLSPYQFNPTDFNPLRELLKETVDFDRLRDILDQPGKDRLFIGATNVTRGDLKIFHGREVRSEAVMASATLPDIFHPAEINGEVYWDGGYMGNPPLEPLRYGETCDDTVIVQINPFRNAKTPKSRDDIEDAANKLMFNSALVTELRDLERMNHLFETGKLKPTEEVRPQRVHRIIDPVRMRELGHSSKGNTSRQFLAELKQLGREAADQWLRESAPKIGKESTWKFDWSNPIELFGRSAPSEDVPPAMRLASGPLARRHPGHQGHPGSHGDAAGRYGRLRHLAGQALGHDQPEAAGAGARLRATGRQP